MGIKEKRAELGRTTSHVGGQEGRGPGDTVEALERIQGEGLPQGLIGRCTGLMKISDMKTRFALGKGVIFVPVHVPC